MSDDSLWPVASPLSGREETIAELASAVADGHCSSLVGMSNIGKSFVLRALCGAPGIGEAPSHLCVYVDCNRMVDFTEQGFYELVLRCLKGEVATRQAGDGLADRLEQCYADVIAPSTPFLAHLRFSEAIAAACEGLPRRIVLVLDEFDEVIEGIGDRVLLNLRALRDAYPGRLAYITASRRRLGELRESHGSAEFAELFDQSTHFLGPLTHDAAAALVGQHALDGGLPLTPGDVPLILEETCGHPALLSVVCHALGALRDEAQAIGRPLSPAQIREQLDSDPACQAECAKLWQELDQGERHVLLQLDPPDGDTHRPAWQSLAERHLVRSGEEGLAPFCRLFATFVRRQRIARQTDVLGVRVDVESGDATVDGRPVPALTDLEYRLLLLLYGHLDKLVDKYAVVEAVWGQNYIDEVDDARIEKLVSRLRQKIEVDPSRPRYLLTVRGRGYKLVGR